LLFKVRNGALPPRDVKNETTSGDVYENAGGDDKMSCAKQGFFTKMHQSHDSRRQSVGFIGRKCRGYAIIRGECRPQIGPSAHRPLVPSEEPGNWFWMARLQKQLKVMSCGWQVKSRPENWTLNLRSQIGDRTLQITNRKSAIENRKMARWSDGLLARSPRLSIMY